MKRNWIRKAHRWLGLVFSLTVLTSSGSGLLHTVMTRTQSALPLRGGIEISSGSGVIFRFPPSLDASVIRIPVAEAIQHLPSGDYPTSVHIRMIGGKPWYQIFTHTNAIPLYVSAVDGQVDPAQDEAFAHEIVKASYFSKKFSKTNYLQQFDNEYLNIFRILPVYRFDVNDDLGTRVYVSTTTGTITRHTDNRRQFEATAFTNLHKFGFIPNKNVRDWTLGILTGGAFLVSLLGIVLFFLTGRRKSRKS